MRTKAVVGSEQRCQWLQMSAEAETTATNGLGFAVDKEKPDIVGGGR